MAEGGRLQPNINLCENQVEKWVEGKSIEEKSGFPELPVSSSHGSLAPLGLGNNGRLSTLTPIHQHQRNSETEMKQLLDNAPSLNSAPSQQDIHDRADQPPNSDSHTKVSNLHLTENYPLTAKPVTEEQSLPTGAVKISPSTESGEVAGETSFASTYMLAAHVSSTGLETASHIVPSTPSQMSLTQEGMTNNLSSPRQVPPSQPPPPIFQPSMPGPAGLNSMLGVGGMVPIMLVPVPMGFDPRVHSVPPISSYAPFTYPMTHVNPGQPAMIGQPMAYNISCGFTGMANGYSWGNGNSCGGMGGDSGVPRGGPLTHTFGAYGSQHTMDSRNVVVNTNGSAPSSGDENNKPGMQSYSLNPGQGTRLTRLREPMLQWIRKRLDQDCEKNWEAVADVHGLNYQEIREHLSDCRHSKVSPFLKLLDMETFCAYTVQDFLNDMQKIGRKDILMDFDEAFQKCS